MNTIFSDDPSNSAEHSWWDSAVLAFTGSVLYHDKPHDAAPETAEGDDSDAPVCERCGFKHRDLRNCLWNPHLSQRDPAHDSGGRQPGLGFFQRITSTNPKPWFTYSLDPLRAAFHGFRLPVLGIFSIIIEKTAQGGFYVYSLVYMALPTLSWFLGIDPSVMWSRPYKSYRVPEEYNSFLEPCDTCGEYVTDQGVFVNANAFASCTHVRTARLKPPYLQAWRLPDEYFDKDILMYDSYAALIARLDINIYCDHPDLGHSATSVSAIPKPTLDGLYINPPGTEWRARETHGGLRCHTHHSATMHGWHPKLLHKVLYEPPKTGIAWDSTHIRLLQDWNNMVTAMPKDRKHFLLCGLTAGRLKHHTLLADDVVVLYNEATFPASFKRHFGKVPENYTFFRAPMVGWHGRYIANLRVFLASFTNRPIKIAIVNQAISARERAYIDHLLDSPYDWVSGTSGHFYPAYAGAMIVKGHTGKVPLLHALRSFHWGCMMYGWDEIFPAYLQANVAYCAYPLGSPALMLGLTSYSMREPETAVVITKNMDYPAAVQVIKWSRQAIYWVNRLAGSDVDPGRLTFWHVWADPRPVFVETAKQRHYALAPSKRNWYTEYTYTDTVPPPRRVVAPGDHVLQELAASLGGIRFITIGTHGDVVPFQALARYIASYSVPVSLIRLNDADEGKALLKGALGKLPSEKYIPIFNRARSHMLANCSGATMVHAALMTADVPTLDLAPPSDLIEPRVVNGSWAISLITSILGVWFAPSATVGPYSGDRVVPTSHNGQDFLRMFQNTGENDYGAVWGSDEEPPKGFEHIPIVPPGDHLQLFRKYKNIVCHGGAGTVSTAAAAGARVIVPVGGLDRNRRNPYDAGLGLQPGADPDNIFLVLADQDIRFLAFWLRRNMFKPWKLFRFYGFPGLGWTAFRFLMLYTLYANSYKTVAVSTEPLIVLAGVLGFRPITWTQFSALLLAAKGIDLTLLHLNISYLRILTTFVSYNLRMATSPIGLFICVKHSIGFGLLYTSVTPVVYNVLQHFVQAVANTVLGVKPFMQPSGEDCPPVFTEFSLRLAYGIPVVHTALVCPALKRRYEGKTRHGIYTLGCSDGDIESSTILPCYINWKEVEDMPRRSGRYSLAWNCQTSIILAFRHKLSLLGIGGIPMYLTTLFAASVYSVNAVAVTVLNAIIKMLPAGGIDERQEGTYLDVAAKEVVGLWNNLSIVGYWDPVTIVDWWRAMYLPV